VTGRVVALAAALALWAAPGAAETVVSVYVGRAFAPDTDLRLRAPGGDDVTYHGVSWETESFRAPIHYGVRLTHWLAERPEAGLALDFTHAKVFLEDGRVRVTGTRGGTPVDQVENVSDSIGAFANSHGLNFLTLNALFRGRAPAPAAPAPAAGVTPYVGLGAGITIPHVEADIGGRSTGEYQYGGPAVQALAGLSYRAGRRWTVFGEYKLNRAWLKESLSGGGSARLDVTVHELVVGVGPSF
jgi:lipid A oxidase